MQLLSNVLVIILTYIYITAIMVPVCISLRHLKVTISVNDLILGLSSSNTVLLCYYILISVFYLTSHTDIVSVFYIPNCVQILRVDVEAEKKGVDLVEFQGPAYSNKHNASRRTRHVTAHKMSAPAERSQSEEIILNDLNC